MFRRLSLWVGCVALATALPLPSLHAEDASEAKIRLLSEALRARDDGDLTAARARLEELLRIAPNDPTVLRLLASLEQSTAKKVTVTGGTLATADRSAAREAEELARAEEQRLTRLIAAAQQAMREARDLAARQDFAAALERLARARAALPENPLTAETHAALAATAADIDRAGGEFLALRAAERAQPAPVQPPAASQPVEVRAAPSPAPVAVTVAPAGESIAALVARGRSQYLAGDPSAAAQTFARTLELDPGNAEARDFLRRIANQSVDGNLDRAQTSAQLLNEVARAWQRPGVYREPPPGSATDTGPSPLFEKLNQIVLPAVNFSGMELSRVVSTLSMVSEEFDPTGTAPKGVNIVLVDPAGANPAVNLTLRNLTLKRVLDFVTDSVGYQYEVQADAVVVRAGGEQTALDTQFYPVSRSTVLRMTGRGGQSSGGGSSTFDPITGTGGSAAAAAPQNVESEGQAIRNFLQLAGVSFEGTPGSTLAFDGSQLIVTQTGRNLERIRNILARYSDVRQVEIEAKFMEVQDGALEELGVNWGVSTKPSARTGTNPTIGEFKSSNRTILDAFRNATSSQQIVVDGNVVPIPSPVLPGGVNLGLDANPLANITGAVGEFNVNAIVRALSQKSGSELLSAPKLTVLSGNPATITVAQELRYPQSYGQIQSQVGTGNSSGGGSAGVAITAGTPQEFTTRNIGVELKVTPTVEEDDYSISLDLHPKVTEFEGFVEYGGTSIAISQGTSVTVPSGFYQPIFAVREVSTKVTIWDGATIVMGGLTREDTRKTNDKVPVVGNLPVLGRLFRSSGESAQKRNLLIFVTANLVSPGGSLKKQNVQGLPPGTIFQNPTIVTPAGAAGRAPGAR